MIMNNLPWWDDRSVAGTLISDEDINEDQFSSPKNIYNYLDLHIEGCEEYKRKISVAVWSAMKHNIRNHFLIIGESGCGKTELFRALKKIYPQVVIFNSASCSPKTYKGSSTLDDAFLSIDLSKPSFIVFDEIDKAFAKGNNGELGAMMQAECLKYLEADGPIFVGEERNRRLIDISLTNLIFVGTFSSLKKDRRSCLGFGSSMVGSKEAPVTQEDIIEYSPLTNEFIGRLSGGIIQLPPMTNERALKMIKDIRYSPAKQLEDRYGVSIRISDKKAKELASGVEKYGMRRVFSAINELISDSLFEDPDSTTICI